jgi:hypothetical protein
MPFTFSCLAIAFYHRSLSDVHSCAFAGSRRDRALTNLPETRVVPTFMGIFLVLAARLSLLVPPRRGAPLRCARAALIFTLRTLSNTYDNLFISCFPSMI